MLENISAASCTSNIELVTCQRIIHSRVYVTVRCTVVRPSVHLSLRSAAAVACSWFAAYRPAGRTYWSITAVASAMYQLLIVISCRCLGSAAVVGSILLRAERWGSTYSCLFVYTASFFELLLQTACPFYHEPVFSKYNAVYAEFQATLLTLLLQYAEQGLCNGTVSVDLSQHRPQQRTLCRRFAAVCQSGRRYQSAAARPALRSSRQMRAVPSCQHT